MLHIVPPVLSVNMVTVLQLPGKPAEQLRYFYYHITEECKFQDKNNKTAIKMP